MLSHPAGPVPASMFHDDGTMRKCVKADLAHRLEDGVNSLVELNNTNKDLSVLIRDAMAIIQATQTGDVKVFDDFGKTYFQNLVLEFEKATSVVDVFDRYNVANSVKVGERTRRERGMQAGTGREYNVIGGRPLPPWKKILSASSNKESLTDFLCDYIKKHGTTWLSEHPESEIILAGRLKDGISLTSSGAQEVTNLQCTQEEADTRMIFHAVKADLSFKENSVKGKVIIKSKDTDVFVLAIHYQPQMKNVKELWIECGTTTANKNSHRFIPVHEICEKMFPTFCKILPSVHSLSGCDSTLSFLGIGKKAVSKLLKTKGSDSFEKLALMDGQYKDEVQTAAREFVALLYDPSNKECKYHFCLNKLRSKLALLSTSYGRKKALF